MDWTTLFAAFIGGGLGSVITGTVSVLQLRSNPAQALQARRWIDAEVVADAKSLLVDLDPQRRTLNVDRTPGVEIDRWKDLTERVDQLYRQLLMLGSGHPSAEVSTAANELGLALQWTAHYSQWAVIDLLAGRTITQQFQEAKERHTAAE